MCSGSEAGSYLRLIDFGEREGTWLVHAAVRAAAGDECRADADACESAPSQNSCFTERFRGGLVFKADRL